LLLNNKACGATIIKVKMDAYRQFDNMT